MIETNKRPSYYSVFYGMIARPAGERDMNHSAQLQTQQRGDETRLIMTDRHQGHSALPYQPTPRHFIKKNRACGKSGQLFFFFLFFSSSSFMGPLTASLKRLTRDDG